MLAGIKRDVVPVLLEVILLGQKIKRVKIHCIILALVVLAVLGMA